MKIKLLDLFSGIGGFHLGLERAGFEVESYFSEIDKYAIQVYQNNFKEAKYVGSVTDVHGGQLPRIDAITFGSPCQDFSLAGKRQGMGGERSSLITEAIRLIRECRPRFFIWENVKGTFSSNNGADFWAIIQAFTNIGGYRLEWQLLNTKWFLPQNRERIYLVGYIANGSGGQVFPIGETNQNFSRTIRKKNRDLQCNKTSHSRTIKKNIGNMGSDDTYIKVKSATPTGYEIAEEGDSINYAVPSSKTRRGRVGKGIANTLDTGCNQAIIGYSRNAKGSVTSYHEKQEANTLHSSSGQDGNTDQYVRQSKIRRLTPIECERLQGFPDNWTQYGTEGLISDSQRYKMCGNAVTVDVVKAVTKNIKNII
jgi:DNA (cytosine-5)-methyltransferase 1